VKSWQLTQHAERRLTEIAEWTAKQFGRAQALAYQDALIEQINLLAAGKPPHARSCEVLMHGHRAAPGLLYYRERSHFIIMRKTADKPEILDFLYERVDLVSHIERLSKP
jgi:plasmid stabilization system protein ParE